MLPEFVLIFITILLSSFFSGAEVAIVATSKLKAEQLVHQKVRNANVLLRLKNMPNEALITILIGNNITNVASSALATKISFDYFQSMSIGLITGVMTFIILTFGEIIPKTFVSKNSKRIALVIAPIILILYYVFYPFVKGFSYLSAFVNKLTSNKHADPLVTESEIKYLVQVGAKAGEINDNESSIIGKVFSLDDLPVSKIMTPASEIFSLDWNLTVEQATPLIIEHGFTRMPVHAGSLQKIKGMLTIQDVVGEIYKGNNDLKLKHIMNPVYFVNRSKKLDETLRELQLRNYHLAIVLGNSKKVIGLITVEDILEELVGEIFDEEDKIDFLITQKSDNEWLVKGKTFIRTINKKLNVDLPLTNEFKHLSKFLGERMDSVDEGKTYVHKSKAKDSLLMTIEKSKGESVKFVSIKKL